MMLPEIQSSGLQIVLNDNKPVTLKHGKSSKDCNKATFREDPYVMDAFCGAMKTHVLKSVS